MQPNQQPYAPNPPAPTAYTPEQIAQIRRSNKSKLIWGLVCLIGPTALIIIGILGYAVANFVFSSITTTTGPSYEPISNPVVSILLFIVSGVSVITWLPGIIVGIILLTTRKSV